MEDKNYGTGYIKDNFDIRDYNYSQSKNINQNNKQDINLNDKHMPKVYNQGHMENCTINAIVAVLEYCLSQMYEKEYNTEIFKINNQLSTMFPFYTGRYLASITQDYTKKNVGMSLRNAIRAVSKFGTCLIKDFNVGTNYKKQPDFVQTAKANEFKINAYYRLNTKEDIINALEREIPVIIGTDINIFRDAKAKGMSRNVLNYKGKGNPNHAMVIVGIKYNYKYIDGNNYDCFIIRNSWGESFGIKNSKIEDDLKGCCLIPCDKIMPYLYDMWVIFRDKLDTDSENPDYDKIKQIPNNTVILGEYAYDIDYANDKKNVEEIMKAFNKMRKLNQKVYIKKDGKLMINSGKEATIDKLEKHLIYKNIKGETKEIILN